MTDRCAEVPALAGDRPEAGRENDHLAPRQHHGLPDRLRSGALLDQQELAAPVIDSRAAEQAGELQREGDLPIQILMQAVVAGCCVA